ncbi:MAG TPA: phage holin family protein [Candidatus Limihabitans stercoravium]|nr:phage holin family protein [Candidatus Limihabitans stercoravium]
MNFTAVPIIVICCYLCGEIYKAIFRNHTNAYRFIPLVTSVLGGILGVVIFLTNPEVILDAPNIWIALGVGIVSGASATGANQIIKQIFQQTNEDTENKEDDNE